LLRPTDEEIAKARSLGIDPASMNGPEIREAIRRASRSGELPDFRKDHEYEHLVYVADMLNVPVKSGDGVNGLKQRIEARISQMFKEKGIRPGAKIGFANDYPHYGGQEVFLLGTNITWQEFKPQVHIKIAASKLPRPVGAHLVALHAFAL
jgi:hypothetical protein